MVRKTIVKKNKGKLSKDNDLRKRLSDTADRMESKSGKRNCEGNRSNEPKAERPRKVVSEVRRPLLPKLLSVQEMSRRYDGGRPRFDIAKELENRMIVYIMGPYSADPEFHTSHAMKVANIILEKGGVPFIPHLTHFWDKRFPRPWIFWITYDLYLADNFKKKNICAVRIPGPSHGADIEEKFFVEKGLRVYNLKDVTNPKFKFPRRKAYGR